ncbi:MAG: homocysteine S-methyltransferase family protein [Clostridia bacterium]|nr:homocysteine S-methyltransferase family protein [Clostridia bacterium]
MNIMEAVARRRLYFDGGMGTLLQGMGLAPGAAPERWNLSHPDRIASVHRAYLDAGCDIIKMNTFGINELRFDDPETLIEAAAQCARSAIGDRTGKYMAYDMGPTGKLLEPLGNLPFERAVEIFGRCVRAAVQAGADLILIETMSDAYETKAAVLAAKENSTLPVFVTNAYDGTGKLMTGADPAAMVALLEGLGVDALGVNCSVGPDQLTQVVDTLCRYASVPVIVNPNAGLPSSVDGKPVYSIGPAEFAAYMVPLAQRGAAILGVCCGTTPEYIAALIADTQNLPYALPERKPDTLVSSYTHAVTIGEVPLLIGERINPTGKKKVKEALRRGDLEPLLRDGLMQADAGAHLLDVNVGLPDIDEPAVLVELVQRLQAVTDLPLQLDTTHPEAMARAMRIYNGKPLVNSVNGTTESMRTIFPLVKKYGGAVIALTIDENGIPDTAEGRCAVAEKIVRCAEDFGIPRKEIIVDPLAMAVSADPSSAKVTLDAIRLIKARLGVATSLGVSNISFGLPAREVVNASFFGLALGAGLDCAIMNPFSVGMMQTYHAFNALMAHDPNCASYIAHAAGWATPSAAVPAATPQKSRDVGGLKDAICRGLREEALREAQVLLQTTPPLTIIETEIIPALDEAGRTFEQKTTFLPQLLVTAETASAVFDLIKAAMPAAAQDSTRKVVLATVRGDIHDIGKNIVRVLLESFGFTVIDLGRDVAAETVLQAVQAHACKLVGLSALMTTTVPAMGDTIALLRKEAPGTTVVVGGAVLTQEYADRIGADFYAADAMETVRFAQKFYA